ncbi:MAG: TldD/PmbA family protein [Bacteroidales bacterium]|nr:TldD/PmbA family protein [Bacteroidales bacterium]
MNHDGSDIFGVTLPQMREIVAEGLKGGDWCDLYFEQTVYNDLLLRDGIVASGGFHLDYGCGIRVLNGEKTGYAYSESTDMDSLRSAAKAATAISGHPGSISAGGIRPEAPELYCMKHKWSDADKKALCSWLEKLEAAIRQKEARTRKVIAMLSFSESEVMMYNSLDELSSDSRPLGSVTLTAIFGDKGRTEQRSVSRSFRCGSEMLDEQLISTLAEEAVRNLDDSFAARRPKGGRMPVVMAAGASGILLHEAMGHAFEADFNRKGQSVFCDRMGQRICRKGINIIDDATIPGNRGALRFDDEGVPGQKTYMVQDGVLTSYLHDRISASWYGVRPTGNGRRESFRYNPIPRMRTTYMESGSDGSLDDLIASVRKGIYVDKFANGEVRIGEGDFTFYVKNGYLIENGRLTMPVKDINIIGNGPQALADIEAVASDLKIDDGTWTCGKEQSVAVSCGIPSVLVKNLTVGGE